MRPLQRVCIQPPEGESGELSHDQDYLFRYGIGARADQQVSLTMGGSRHALRVTWPAPCFFR